MRSLLIPTTILLFSLVGCATYDQNEWIPPELLTQIDTETDFEHLKESPESHTGKILFVGGEVLHAIRKKDHTQLMILQLPLNESHEPVRDRLQSQGRFLAQELDFLDPAIVPEGTRITIVGTVTGSHTELLDEMDYTYPTITIEQLKVWPKTFDYRYYPYRFRPYWRDPFYWSPYLYGPYPSPFFYW